MRPTWNAMALGAFMAMIPLAPAAAQNPSGEWQIIPYGSSIGFDESSAIERGPAAGLNAVYFINDYIAIGQNIMFGRTTSDGSYFKPLRWNIGPDTTRIMQVGQELSLVTLAGRVEFHYPLDRFSPFVAAGGGLYYLFLDPQSNSGPQWYLNPMLEAAGGVDIALSSNMGVRLGVRDLILTDYDRDRLDMVEDRFDADNVGAPVGIPPKEDMIHNIAVSLGFTYIP